MNTDLKKLINQYQHHTNTLFTLVTNHLNVELPIRNVAWSLLDIDALGETKEGVNYYKHGYGVRMCLGDIDIDLDLGADGQINGFDAWRLFNFAVNSNFEIPFKSFEDVQTAINEAVTEGDVVYSGYMLYYLK